MSLIAEPTHVLLNQIETFRRRYGKDGRPMPEYRFAISAGFAPANIFHWKNGFTNPSEALVAKARNFMNSYAEEHPTAENMNSEERRILGEILGRPMETVGSQAAENIFSGNKKKNYKKARWNSSKEEFVQSIRQMMKQRGWGVVRASVELGTSNDSLSKWLKRKGMKNRTIVERVRERLEALRGGAVLPPVLQRGKKKSPQSLFAGQQPAERMQKVIDRTPVRVRERRGNELSAEKKIEILNALRNVDGGLFGVLFEHWFPGQLD